MIAVLLLLSVQNQTVTDTKTVQRLVAKVIEIGQKRAIDKHVGAFVKLEGKEITWHSKFDSERQVQVFQATKVIKLIFLVPEKPFPEFGKSWIYCLTPNGKLEMAGVAEPRQPFVPLGNATAMTKNAKAEVAYWCKELEIGKS